MNTLFSFVKPVNTWGMGAVATKALINYKWSTLPVSSDYVTDGVELVTNGGFDTDLNGWLSNSGGALSWNSGTIEIRRDGTGNGFPKAQFNMSLESGSMYQVKATCISSTSGTYEVYLQGSRESGTQTQGQFAVGEEVVFYPTIIGSNSIMLSGSGFSTNNTNDVVVFDNISVQKVIQKPNTMYLKDSGMKPKYNAEMNSGKSIHGNSIDQSIPINTISLSGDFTIVLRGVLKSNYLFLGSGTSNSDYVHIDNASSLTMNLNYHLNTFNISVDEINSRDLVIRRSGTIIEVFLNNILIGSATSSNAFTIDYIGQYNNTVFGFEVKDLYIFNDTLTQAEITKYSTQPNEFFQDVQDGVIDNCVLNMPLDGTDKYVRDYASYSETEQAEEPDFNTSTGWQTLGTGTISGGELIVSNGTTNDGVLHNNLVTGETYLIEVILSAYTSGQPRIYFTQSIVLDTTIIGTPQFFIVSLTAGTTCYLNDNFSGNANWKASRFSIKQLTGIHQIQNYTTSCRDTTSALNYGSQELNFLRAGLWRGDLSKYLECNGEGYVDTGWTVKSNTYWQIEIIMEVHADRTDGYFQLHPFYLSTHSAIDLYIRLDDAANSVSVGVGLHHVSMEFYGGTTNELNVNVDGTAYSNSRVATLPNFTSTKFTLNNYTKGKLPLLKVHTTHQDPLKLYNKALAKGLLS